MSTSPTQEGGDEGEDVTFPEWIHVQKKTFTNWVNEKLKGTSYRVDDLEKDLDDGVTLIKLLETLANKKMHKRYSQTLSLSFSHTCTHTHHISSSLIFSLLFTLHLFPLTLPVFLRYNAKPRLRIQKSDNLVTALDFITKVEKIKLQSIGK